MLKSSGEGRGFTAKVADFGLSVKMSSAETHMNNMYQGTMTHMAPELLMEGRVSKAADVRAISFFSLSSLRMPPAVKAVM
jgi:serine/threonine protein kinase